MTGQESGSDRTPQDGYGTAPVPDEVWQKFLTDSESAIRRSAPREPSAWERTVLARRERPEAEGATGAEGTAGAVGELWQPEDRWGGPAWRDMDSRARRRRVGRAVGTVAALALLFGALSLLPASSRNPYQDPGGTVSQQSEEAPEELPAVTATTLPSAAFAPDGT
ncbi:hypothetical protein [Streptomyces sp. DH24]|uniref:hypothetical protein n=1 Tax=Streptomyces sp. DH24 TaxID=3040123 RepID=UPI002441D925|nr:hypothetical protein [Streptomyces sp. DH24]MDG9717858.1 hypothetical protein [Streptomyces sp. DH24]